MNDITWIKMFDNGHYLSKDGRFQIRLKFGTKDEWILSDKESDNTATYNTLRKCKEEAKTRVIVV